VAADDIAELGITLARLIDDPGERGRLANAAGALYAERFDLRHTIAALRNAACA